MSNTLPLVLAKKKQEGFDYPSCLLSESYAASVVAAYVWDVFLIILPPAHGTGKVLGLRLLFLLLGLLFLLEELFNKR